jgi:hypothetical protein
MNVSRDSLRQFMINKMVPVCDDAIKNCETIEKMLPVNQRNRNSKGKDKPTLLEVYQEILDTLGS